MQRFHLFSAAAVCFLAATMARADVSLAEVLSSNMVLQRNAPVPVWGTATAGEEITVEFTFSGSFGQKVNVNSVTGGVEWNRLWQPWATDSWTPTNTSASLPKRYSANDGTRSVYTATSDFWIKNGDYLRLRTLAVGYNIPKDLCKKIGVEGIRFFASGSNLFLISGFNSKYWDPELGNNGTNFPIMRSMNLGANVRF